MTDNGLPVGWARCVLADTVGPDGLFTDGDWVESKDQDPKGGVRLIQLADIGDGEYRNRSARFLTKSKAAELSCTFLRPGDILVSRMADPLGRACIFPGDDKPSVTVVDACIIRSQLDQRWLMRQINAPQARRSIGSAASGTTRKRVSRKNLGIVELPIPPLNEQRRIVAKIDALQARTRRARASLETVRALLEQFRRSVLAAAFRGDLTADWRAAHPDVEPASALLERIRAERRRRWEEAELAKLRAKGKAPKGDGWKEKYKEPEPVDATGLPELPEGWCWASLAEASCAIDYGHTASANTDRVGPRFLRITDIQDGMVNWDNVPFCECDAPEPLLLKPRDIVVARTGATTGKSFIISDPPEPAVFASYLIRVLTSEQYSASFLWFYLQSDDYWQQITTVSKGSAQPGANASVLSRLRVPVAPAEETAVIASRVAAVWDSTRSMAQRVTEQADRTRVLDESILAKAFRGELVAQDPSDEPASALLERIRAEREGAGAKKAGRGGGRKKKAGAARP